MAGAPWNFVVNQGATFNPTLTYRDAARVAKDLTGFRSRMQVRDGYDAAEPLFDLTTENGGITLGGTAGTIIPYISDEDIQALLIPTRGIIPPQKDFAYDLNLINVAGVVMTLLYGKFSVIRAVTR